MKITTNNKPQDDWWMKDPKWYVIGSSFIMPALLLGLWLTIIGSILFS